MTVSMDTTRLSSVITGCGGNETDLLAQVDERGEAVHERHQDRQTRGERPLVAAEAFHHPGPRLRDDPDRPGQRDHDDEHDEGGHHEGDGRAGFHESDLRC